MKNKRSARTFYKGTLTVEILSEHPLDDMGLEDMVSAGDCDIQYELETQEIDGKQMAEELLERNSGPAFFALTKNGEDIK